MNGSASSGRDSGAAVQPTGSQTLSTPRWSPSRPQCKSVGGSETALPSPDGLLGIHKATVVQWPYLIALDAGQFSARCRSCRWISSPSGTLAEVRRAGEKHICPGSPSLRQQGQRLCWPRSAGSTDPIEARPHRAGGGGSEQQAPGEGQQLRSGVAGWEPPC
jgi:hypothetical protein